MLLVLKTLQIVYYARQVTTVVAMAFQFHLGLVNPAISAQKAQ